MTIFTVRRRTTTRRGDSPRTARRLNPSGLSVVGRGVRSIFGLSVWICAAACAAPPPDPASPDPPKEVPAPPGSAPDPQPDPSPPEATRPGDVAPECFGDLIDLGELIQSRRCAAEGDPRPPPPGGLESRLSIRDLDVTAGDLADGKVTIQNVSEATVVFDLVVNCDPAYGFRGTLESPGQATPVPTGPADRIEGWSGYCDAAARCARSIVRVGLAPTHRAVLDLKLATHARGKSDACDDVGTAPVAPGNYVVTVEVPLAGGAVTARHPLRVR